VTGFIFNSSRQLVSYLTATYDLFDIETTVD